MSQNTKTVVVTGGCGFIGSHIAKVLQYCGYKVTIIDKVRREHTLKYCDHFINDDFDSEESHNYFASTKVDAIVHCAGYIVVGDSVGNPSKYYENNVAKTITFLDKLIAYNKFLQRELPVVVFSSSAAVYGNPKTVPIKETAATKPMNPYGHSKLMIEQVLKDHSHAYGLKSISLRYFNACGADPYEHDLGQAPGATHIIPRLVDAYKNKTTFTINGSNFKTEDGTCVRDYIHVQDLATAHIKAIEYLLSGGKTQALNLGTNMGYSNDQVVDTFCRMIGEIEVEYGPRREGDPDVLVADATKAKEILNWQPQYSTMPVIIDSIREWYNL